MAVIAIFAMELNGSRFPSLITSITKPGCNIKGNISINTGAKVYHVPGTEDYESTVIDPTRGEKWFCTESEAIASSWRKAPR
ncbi:sunset domain-containing protein [Tolypothrix sp. VBCCA 56010]|uniref:sunset domain-containing protein n=1 Tax=Tolypothrix sp. VBCCA 56010 TaxID=3137731 RepID=UPI003D7CBBA4